MVRSNYYKMLVLISLITSLMLYGCLVGNKIVYEVNVNKAGKGTATIMYMDIRSNSTNDEELEEDENNLFDYMLKSEKFIQDMKKEGKEVTSRNLYIENEKLNGKATFKFNRLNDVENITYEDGFYFLTLNLADSVVSTNGIIIKSPGYKRILWDSTYSTLKFEIFTEPADNANLVELAPSYKAFND